MMLPAALQYLNQGWAVFPCAPSKAPLVPGGFHSASSEAKQIRRWWTRWPEALIGAAVPESLAVIDIDNASGGLFTLGDLQDDCGPLPETLTCLTGGGGLHEYFLHPGGHLRQGAGLLGVGIDTRMPGLGYVILPPSLHPSGNRYVWEDPDVLPAAMPGWMVIALRRPAPKVPRLQLFSSSEPYVAAAVRGEAAAVAKAPVGSRHETLRRAACRLGTLTGLLDEGEAVTALLAAAHANGYLAEHGQRVALSTIESGLAWGARRPRQVPSFSTPDPVPA